MAEVTIEESLEFIRMIQPECMEAGYYLTLGGGVLNNGHSNNDLDLVAVPRTNDSTDSELIEVMNKYCELTRQPGRHCRGRKIDIHHYKYCWFDIDLAIVDIQIPIT